MLGKKLVLEAAFHLRVDCALGPFPDLGLGLIGPAFKSEYLLAKTEVMADEIYQEVDNYVAAIEWGEALGADITCASLGYYDWYEYMY